MNNDSKKIVSKAEWLRKYKVKRKLLVIVATLLAILILTTYVATYVYTGFGSFTISVKKNELMNYGITLSTDLESEGQVSKLNAIPIDGADAIYSDEINLISGIDQMVGSHNGNNYMAYAFYCMNIGTKYDLTYSYTMTIRNVTKNLDDAIRIKLYINNIEQGIYGKEEKNGENPLYNYELNLQNDEKGEKIYDRQESNQIKKFSNNTILQGEVEHLLPRSVSSDKRESATKFTVIMWIEGTDPECTNKILGGSIRVDMNIAVVNAKELFEAK